MAQGESGLLGTVHLLCLPVQGAWKKTKWRQNQNTLPEAWDVDGLPAEYCDAKSLHGLTGHWTSLGKSNPLRVTEYTGTTPGL